MALIFLVVGFVVIVGVYFKLTKYVRSKKFHYTHPSKSLFIQYAMLPLFAIVIITSVNVYIGTLSIFEEIELIAEHEFSIRAAAFVKIMDSINILVIGWTIANLIPLIIFKYEKNKEKREDFEKWKEVGGFQDDDEDLFHRLYKWRPPQTPPADLTDEDFEESLKTEEGRKFLEEFRTTKGLPIGSYEQLVNKPFEEWEKSEHVKYDKYLENCINGNNESGRKLVLGRKPEEIYSIDIWREEKRMGDYSKIIPGARQPGYSENKRKNIPQSIARLIRLGIFAAVIIGVVTWLGVDLIVLATTIGGLSIGVGFALQETMQNYFAYILIRKDKIFIEGERIKLDTGYNGYVHKITPRVTYIRDALNESIAIIPTRQLVNAQIINYTKDEKMVPAIIDVGVSYLNDPKQVSAILVKVGKRAMNEVVDGRGRHMIKQTRCPYIDEHKSSCGCDKDIHVDINQPVVRFNQFNDSALDFSLWVYVRDYGAQFKTKTDMRVIMYEEFKRYDIRIPWPIRTVYQGDSKREAEEIDLKKKDREKLIDEFGIGDISQGGSEGQ